MSDIFETFSDVAFRIEGLPHYRNADGSESAGFVAWSQGEPLPDGFNEEWVDIVREARNRGASVKRLRLVSRSLTPYEEYEVTTGYGGAAAGEQIRVAPRSSLPYASDAWFFDQQTVLHQQYSADGTFLDTEEGEMSAEDHEVLSQAVALFERSPSIDEFLRR